MQPASRAPAASLRERSAPQDPVRRSHALGSTDRKHRAPQGRGPTAKSPQPTILTVSEVPDYAFPHSAENESRRLELLEQRLDPLTKRRIERLGVRRGARCLEIGGGGGWVTRGLSESVGPTGHVTATDLQMGFLSEIDASNVEILRHDVRTDTFPPSSFD